MGVRTILKQKLEEEALLNDVKSGKIPARSYDIAPPDVKAPPVVPGEVANPADWESAIKNIDLWLSAVEETIKNIARGSTAGALRRAESILTGMELENKARLKQGGQDSGRHVYTFEYLPLDFEYGVENLPESSCEIDFYRQCATLRQEDGWCSRILPENARVYWYVEPEGCKVEQLGSVEDLIGEKPQGCILTVTGAPNTGATLVMEIELAEKPTLNYIIVDANGQGSIKVFVNDKEVQSVDGEQKWYMFPATGVEMIRIQIEKTGYDDDSRSAMYFSLRGIEMGLRKYRKDGVLVLPPVEINCTEVTAVPDASLPAGTSVDTYVGFQRGKRVEWHLVSPDQWLKVPGLPAKSEELLTVALDGQSELYKLAELHDTPLLSSLELYPAYNMWVAERKPAGASTQCSLQFWYAANGTPAVEFIPAYGSTILQDGYIYRFYTYVKCDDQAAISRWRPQPENTPHKVYLNWIEQVPTSGYYDLHFKKGWNLVEIIVVPNNNTAFAPLLAVGDIGAIMCGTPGSAIVKPFVAFLQEEEPNLKSAGCSGSSLYVRHNKGTVGNVQYLCRYYTDRGTRVTVRPMIIMKSSSSDYSPVLSSCALRWR